MLSSHDIERVYGPDTLKIMTAAFDNAHQCLPAKFKENDHARRKLALLIIRHMERGSVIHCLSPTWPCLISCDNPVCRKVRCQNQV